MPRLRLRMRVTDLVRQSGVHPVHLSSLKGAAMNRFLYLLLIAISGSASSITWTLQNAVFTDGGVATGSFVFDADTQTVVSYNIQTSGGNTANFPAFLFQNGVGYNEYASPSPGNNFIDFETYLTNGNISGMELRLGPLNSLTDAGGTVGFSVNSMECYNCDPRRTFASGQLVAGSQGAGVPEPASLGLIGVAFAMMAAARLYRRRG